MHYYSATTGGFYIVGIHREMPLDIVNISEEFYRRLMEQQSQGFKIIADENGYPTAIAVDNDTNTCYQEESKEVPEMAQDIETEDMAQEPDHRLYILARTDIYQMNPGKLAAQVAHAGTKFILDLLAAGDLPDAVHEWAGCRGFGTKITLAATGQEIRETVVAMKHGGFIGGTVVDPTYPYTNFYGEFFTAEELTCGYVFVPDSRRDEAREILSKFKLHQ